jgi:hypothetical protein
LVAAWLWSSFVIAALTMRVPAEAQAYRLPDTSVTATYGAFVTTERRVWLMAAFFVLALLALVGFIIVIGMFTGEYWCQDRHPWWGPPESGSDPNCGLP